MAADMLAADFERIFDEHQRRLYYLARRVVRNAQDAEEVVQDAFFRAHRALRAMPPGERTNLKLRAWLTTITLNVARNRLRKKRLPSISIDWFGDVDHLTLENRVEETPESAFEHIENLEIVESAIRNVSKRLRTTARLRFIDGLSHAEIAAQSHEPIGTVKSRVHRAAVAMRKLLTKENTFMSKLQTAMLHGIIIAALTTAVAHAQVVSQTPAPKPTHGPEYFVAGDYLFTPNSQNEFNPTGNDGNDTFAGRAAVEYPFGKIAVMMEGTYDHYQYTTQAGFVPSFYAHDIDWDGRIGIGLRYPRVFAVASYAQRSSNDGYPNLQGYGFGIEKLPDFDSRSFSVFGSYLWYPSFEAGNTLQYGFYKYQAGVEFHAPTRRIPVFIEAGYMGDYGYNKENAPTNISDRGVFAGLGFHF